MAASAQRPVTQKKHLRPKDILRDAWWLPDVELFDPNVVLVIPTFSSPNALRPVCSRQVYFGSIMMFCWSFLE
jgi:hypothetical protein